MTDILGLLHQLERPRLLMQAARRVLRDYRRETSLPALLRDQALPGSCEAALRLLDMEQACEGARLARDGTYNPQRHIQVMAAILGEAREIAERRLPQVKASATAPLRLAM